jgi:hypothetical protein
MSMSTLATRTAAPLVPSSRFVAALAFVAAAAPLLFALAFFVLLPSRGLDLERFGEPQHVLEVFGAEPLLLRAVALNNVALMLCAAAVALAVVRRFEGASELQWTAGAAAALGWLLYLVGEMFDLTAYLSMPGALRAEPAQALQAFFTPAARRPRRPHVRLPAGGPGNAGPSGGMRPSGGWPRALRILGLLAAGINVATFGVELLSTSLSGDAGEGGWFNALLGANTLVVAAWHARLGAHLWRSDLSRPGSS